MREIFLNGYIDEDVWFGDEITPGMLNDQLYCSGNDPKEDIRIILNSYGGNCNAATRIFQDIIVSGNAGDCFVLGGWAKGDSVPLGELYGVNRRFALIATFYNGDAQVGESLQVQCPAGETGHRPVPYERNNHIPFIRLR